MASSRFGLGATKVGGLATAAASTLGLLALFGCGSLGDRARSGCPEGEVCSAATPNGLRFYGAALQGTLSNGANTMVVGGTQNLRWEDARETSLQPLPDHVVTSGTPSVIELTATRSGGATLTARASGSSLLRITEPSGPLLDRITVSAAPLDRVQLGRTIFTDPAREVAYLAGQRTVYVELLSAEGGRLVDESATVEADVATPPSARSWDSVSVNLPAGEVMLTVTSAGQSFDVSVPVFAAADAIGIDTFVLGADTVESVDPLRLYENGLLCFEALAGGRKVLGLEGTFSYVVDGVAGEGDATLPCVEIPGVEAGTIQIEITLGGFTQTFTAQLLASETMSMSLVTDEPLSFVPRSRGALGERASLSRALALPEPDRDVPRGI